MANDTIDLSLLGKMQQKTNDELRTLRKEMSEIRTMTLQTYDYMNRLERRQIEQRDNLELTIKMELGGGIHHLQSVLEASLARIEDKVDGLAERLAAVEARN